MCAYCGSRLDLDLQGWAHLQAGGINEELHCPDCHSPLETLRLGVNEATEVGRCRGCLGLFLPLGRLEELLDQAVGTVWGVDYDLLTSLTETPRSSAKPWRYRSCPSCGELMNRSLQGQRSGVVVDLCRDHGIWLDAGELRQLLEWARAGGLVHDRQHRDQERCEHERLEGILQRELEDAQQRRRQDSPLEGLLRRLARQLL